jgi:hypothetical protein
MVGETGFEPATPCTPCKCATRLRHSPKSPRSLLPCSHRWQGDELVQRTRHLAGEDA